MRTDPDTLQPRAVECFAHGLAHLIAVYGYRSGLARAGEIIVDLYERESEVTKEGDSDRVSCLRSTQSVDAPVEEVEPALAAVLDSLDLELVDLELDSLDLELVDFDRESVE